MSFPGSQRSQIEALLATGTGRFRTTYFTESAFSSEIRGLARSQQAAFPRPVEAAAWDLLPMWNVVAQSTGSVAREQGVPRGEVDLVVRACAQDAGMLALLFESAHLYWPSLRRAVTGAPATARPS